MTCQVELGTDTLGNITLINNALEKLPDRLNGAKSQLEGVNRQIEAAKIELAKPFKQENELQEKETRLAFLNADLNIDGEGGFEIIGDTESRKSDEFVESIAGALDDMDVKYTRGYTPDTDNDGDSDDDIDDKADGEVRPQYGIGRNAEHRRCRQKQSRQS